MRSVADEYGDAVSKLIKADWESRLDAQKGPSGEAMPKKKYPQRSLQPNKFLVNTGQSTRFTITKVGNAYVVSAARPEILNYPNPKKGLDVWFGIPQSIVADALHTLKGILSRWL